MKIVFVGDSPSKKNANPEIPFVGTTSYKKLLSWIADLNIYIKDVELVNQDKLSIDYITGKIEYNSASIGNCHDDVIITLGENAKKKIAGQEVRFLKIKHFELPHPSGMNRKLNNSSFIKNKIRECQNFLLKSGYVV